MPVENGVNWKPIAPEQRGRHKTAASAFDAAFKALSTERDDFFDSLADGWKTMFPDVPARPGRHEGGRIYLYVRNAPMSYAVRPRLRAIAAKLATLPGAPKKIDLRLEVHAS